MRRPGELLKLGGEGAVYSNILVAAHNKTQTAVQNQQNLSRERIPLMYICIAFQTTDSARYYYIFIANIWGR